MSRHKGLRRRRPYRHRLLLDEGVHNKKLIPRVNSRHNLLHVRDDLHKQQLDDKKVYNLANQLDLGKGFFYVIL